MTALLACRDVSAGYGAIEACRDIDLEVPEGHVMVITGPNGAGKTTLIRRISGQVKGGGSITLDGREIGGLAAHKRTRLGLITVPEGRGLLVDLTVRENVELASLLLPSEQRQSAFERAVERFPILGDRRELPAGALSGGEQQMVALARVLVLEPRVLLLDEPSQGLAPAIVEEIALAVEEFRGRGVAVVLVEQHLDLARRVADSVAVMIGGEINLRGDGTDLLDEERLADAYLNVESDPASESGSSQRSQLPSRTEDDLRQAEPGNPEAESPFFNSPQEQHRKA